MQVKTVAAAAADASTELSTASEQAVSGTASQSELSTVPRDGSVLCN